MFNVGDPELGQLPSGDVYSRGYPTTETVLQITVMIMVYKNQRQILNLSRKV